MATFNTRVPGDVMELSLRVRDAQRHMLQTMFLSDADNKAMLETALAQAMENFDLLKEMREAAVAAIRKGIENYFQYGDGSRLIAEVVRDAAGKCFERVMRQD